MLTVSIQISQTKSYLHLVCHFIYAFGTMFFDKVHFHVCNESRDVPEGFRWIGYEVRKVRDGRWSSAGALLITREIQPAIFKTLKYLTFFIPQSHVLSIIQKGSRLYSCRRQGGLMWNRERRKHQSVENIKLK